MNGYYTSASGDQSGWYYVVFLALIGLYLLLRAIYWHYKVTPIIMANHYDEPVISSHQLGVSTQSMGKGNILGYPYNLLTNASGDVMLLVTFARNTNLHMVAIGGNSVLLQLLAEQVSNKMLEPVELEGDFPEYFRVYCTPGKQIELLQVLEPANMQHLVDFCKGYNFEIFKDTLYVSQAEKTADRSDTTTLVADVEKFIRNNRNMLK